MKCRAVRFRVGGFNIIRCRHATTARCHTNECNTRQRHTQKHDQAGPGGVRVGGRGGGGRRKSLGFRA